MRRFLFMIIGGLGAMALVATASTSAFADSPHFISEGTASITSSGAYLVSNFKEAGLGSTLTTEAITLHVDSATAVYACVNGGGNHPKASNKQSVTTPLTQTQSFKVRNGQTTGSMSVGPPPAGPFKPPCSPPQTVVLVQVSYSGVELIGLAGDTSAEPDLSACLFPGIGIC
jgi:hypothetical protein